MRSLCHKGCSRQFNIEYDDALVVDWGVIFVEKMAVYSYNIKDHLERNETNEHTDIRTV